MTVKTLTWRQVNGWRLSQHGLAPRLKREDFISAVMRTGGIQAQVMSAAELALWARVDELSPKDVQSALWQDRTLVKTWAMRGTLHLIVASELPMYVAARSVLDTRRWLNYFAYYDITPAQFDAFIAAVAHVLDSEPMTREQLAVALDKHTGQPMFGSLLLSKSWGTPLKPSAFRGDLCFGPNQGRNVTYVHPRKWINQWQVFEPQAALLEFARRYLKVYGPAIPEDFARWWWGGGGIVQARMLFKSMEEEIEAVDVEGWRAFVLRTTLEPMHQHDVSGTVNLLPLFDAYVLGLGRDADLDPLLPRAYQRLVYRPQGWISAVVLVDGYMKGVWVLKNGRSQTTVKVQMFSTFKPRVRNGIEAEVERLGAFLNTKVALEYEHH